MVVFLLYIMVVYGYLRVSCEKQIIDNYKNWILRKANDLQIGPVIFIEKTVSEKKGIRRFL